MASLISTPAPPMSQYFPGKTTCSICGVVLNREDDVVMCSAFIGDQADPLWRFSDSTMHRSCFLAWPLRVSFIGRYNQEIGSITWGNGTYHYMRDDGTVVSLPRV